MAAGFTVLPYLDRTDAGRILAAELARRGSVAPGTEPMVLALPRGGVPVASEVARVLGGDLDVYVTRKVGCPGHPELGVGAVAEHGAAVYDDALLHRLGLTVADLADIEAVERVELDRRRALYRRSVPEPEVADRTVVVVDDGLATGATARAALRSLRGRSGGPAHLLFAAPVGAPETVAALRGEADEVVVPATPEDFHAVGRWYREFHQLTDADVLAVLDAHRSASRRDGRHRGGRHQATPR